MKAKQYKKLHIQQQRNSINNNLYSNEYEVVVS